MHFNMLIKRLLGQIWAIFFGIDVSSNGFTSWLENQFFGYEPCVARVLIQTFPLKSAKHDITDEYGPAE